MSDRLIVVLETPDLELARVVIGAGATLLAGTFFDLEFDWRVEEFGGRVLTLGPAATPVHGRRDMLWRCHGLDELPTAADAEFVSLSPIFETATKPGYGPPLGVDVLGRAGRPVYALGGVDGPARAAECVAAGAYGVAVLGAVSRSSDPARAVRNLLTAVGTPPASGPVEPGPVPQGGHR
ncbi:hypothetical protein Lfu02_18750 [Longispora fulva]|uniref:Thiamine-phosphate pyrophosphorylase n=1 Tax=Longispora fulva TaxID=619741 RepID=A0A8J7KND0_9ACTN|nr:thiamine phosphate synthase [Longispora fulva]MBG6140121.1 thiamine-phosphate pyrophosphorylase [Longispora fulva]GIG57503.1 hypothetical protein Lfu02_18750 [Longispora fulva]